MGQWDKWDTLGKLKVIYKIRKGLKNIIFDSNIQQCNNQLLMTPAWRS